MVGPPIGHPVAEDHGLVGGLRAASTAPNSSTPLGEGPGHRLDVVLGELPADPFAERLERGRHCGRPLGAVGSDQFLVVERRR